MSKKLLFRIAILVTAMMCAQGASAQEAYACADFDYTSNYATLTFYYDNDRSSRLGTTFELNAGEFFPSWVTSGFSNYVKYVVFDPSFAAVRPSSTYGWFLGMTNLVSITGLSYLNTSEVTNMVWMFSGCYSLTSLDLSSFNTSKVTSMEGMFQDCDSLTSLDLSSFNTSQVTSMEYMFNYCRSLTSVDLSSFNTSQVTNMEYMFKDCQSLTSLDLSSFNTSQVTRMKGIFEDCCGLTSLDLSSFNTSKVTDMTYMFFNCWSLTSVDLSSFNTSQVTNMGVMFYNCYSLIRLDLSSFNTSKVTEMGTMFFDCTNLRTIFVGSDWTTASLINSDNYMFDGCTSLVGGQGTTYDANHVDATYAHIDGGPSNPGYFTDKNTYLLGDVNGDREVNIADVNAVIDIILGGSGNTVAADVNGDGEINIADINAVIDIILGRNAEPEPEHDWVDLGLPSGTLWATCNVGANSPEEFGHHFAWGETEPKDVYDWSTYKWCNGSYTTITKYCTNSEYGYNGFVDNKTELDLEDDAAYVNWGPSWCMPTVGQQQELYQNCSSVWTTKNGVNGRLFTGPNGNTLFLPAAGGRWDGSLYYVGSYGYYWSRTLYRCFSCSDLAYNLDFTSGYVGCDGDDRIIGFTVRAVRVSQN